MRRSAVLWITSERPTVRPSGWFLYHRERDRGSQEACSSGCRVCGGPGRRWGGRRDGNVRVGSRHWLYGRGELLFAFADDYVAFGSTQRCFNDRTGYGYPDGFKLIHPGYRRSSYTYDSDKVYQGSYHCTDTCRLLAQVDRAAT